MNLTPDKVFFTKGTGRHKDRLASFEDALRHAGIERQNLVYVSSTLPPGCETISKAEGVKLLKPGEITFCVMARNDTNEPNRLISASIGVALPKDRAAYGYLSEHEACGETGKASGDYAEDLAATMLATTLGVPFDPEQAWDQRKQVYQSSGHVFTTRHICQSAEGDKSGLLWTTVIASAVFVMASST
jgi:arginine decarboxylase